MGQGRSNPVTRGVPASSPKSLARLRLVLQKSLLTFGFLLSLALLGAVGLVSYRSTMDLVLAATRKTHTIEVVGALRDLLARLYRVESDIRGYILTGDGRLLASYASLSRTVDTTLGTLRALTADNPIQQERLEALEPEITALLAQMQGAIDRRSRMSHAGDPRLIAAGEGRSPLEATRRMIDALVAEEERLLQRREARVETSTRDAARTVIGGTLLGLGLIALIFTRLRGEIQERRRAESRLRQVAEALRRTADEAERQRRQVAVLLESTAQGIFAIDREGRCTIINEAGARMLGLGVERALGENMHALTHHSRADGSPYPAEECPIVLSSRQGIACRVDTEVLWRQDGAALPVEYASSPILADGEIQGAVVTVSDITERRHAAEQQRAAKEAAEAANRAKSDFLANMSHEIRTPLNGVIGMLDLALDTPLTPEQGEYLHVARRAADTLLEVINDILDFSKIEAGKLTIEPIDFRLRDCLGDTTHALAQAASQKGLELVTRVSPEVPDALVGDPGRLRQVLFNLVGNAIKFTERGEVGVDVDLESRAARDVMLHVRVKDTGEGIPQEKLTAIFEAFTQADTSTTRRHGGTGLGLTIASELVQRMGGRIWVESVVGRGSTFHFTLLMRISDGPAPIGTASETTALHGVHALIVDDNATNRCILEEMLAGWGMQAEAVPDGPDALATIESALRAGRPFGLYLIDGQMPGMDGFALAERIGALGGGRTPMLIMTSGGQRGDAARCRRLGIGAYLQKPLKQSDLLVAITTILRPRPEAEGPPPLVTRHSLRESRQQAGLRILIAEDNALNEMVVTRLLMKHGHRVTIARDGQQALDALDAGSFDMVFMDVQMPVMDGLQATAAIREKEKGTGRRIPIVAMTAHAMKGDRELCLGAGMDDYIAKPLRATQLLEILERIAARIRPAAVAPGSSASAPPASRSRAPRASVPAPGSRPQAQPPDSEGAILDAAALLAEVDGDRGLLRKMSEIFNEQSNELLAELRQAIERRDRKLAERAAHTLKGSVGHWGRGKAFDVARRLEENARRGTLGRAARDYTTLESELGRLKDAIARLLVSTA